MKTIFYIVLAVFAFSSSFISAQSNANKTIYIKGANVTHPILKTWIEEYSKVNPAINIQIADKSTPDTDNAVNVGLSDTETAQSGQVVVQVARFAILPFTNQQNPLLSEAKDKSLDKNNIKRLFFEKDADDDGKYPYKSEATIYSGTAKYANIGFTSQYFEKTADQVKGKKIAGDDIFLVNAVKKDPSGVAFNYLPYLFDTKTRNLKDGIALLPIGVKKEQWQSLSANIDEALDVLEKQKINLIPINGVNLSFNGDQLDQLRDFLGWVTTDGQKYNHDYGFLNIDAKQQSEILKQINYANLVKK